MSEFSEIGPCGGTLTIEVNTTEDGQRTFSCGLKHDSPTMSSVSCIACDMFGNPIRVVQLSWNPSADEIPDRSTRYFITFLKSDTEGAFGHQCPRCSNYWRSDGMPFLWHLTCPYCGLQQATHHFLTPAHRSFLSAVSERLIQAIESDQNGRFDIPLDKIADDVVSTNEPNPFYFAEVRQQEKFRCSLCGAMNDILGRFGFCSCCGFRNNLDCMKLDISSISDSLAQSGLASDAIKNAVSSLEGAGRNLVDQLLDHVPMTAKRQKEASEIRFHQFERFSTALDKIFDIKVDKKISKSERKFISKMFMRRHVYEHSGGVTDEQYLRDSGDTSVRLGQRLHDTNEDALKFSQHMLDIMALLLEGFHDILPVNEEALKYVGPKVMPSQE